MIYGWLRQFLVVLFLSLGILLHLQLGLFAAWYLYVAALLLLVVQIVFGSVWAAFYQLQRGKVDAAQKLLQQTWNPNWLARRHKAYYHFTRGLIALQHHALEPGEADIKKALEYGLQRKRDEALALLNLAHIQYVNKNVKQSRAYVKQVRALEVNDLLIQENLDQLEKVLAQQN